MALQFVLGSSGSGKTEYIYERLVRQAGEHPKKNYLVIVPEQFTMQTQQKLVELAPNHAIMNIDVLSFKRLAYRVFDDMGDAGHTGSGRNRKKPGAAQACTGTGGDTYRSSGKYEPDGIYRGSKINDLRAGAVPDFTGTAGGSDGGQNNLTGTFCKTARRGNHVSRFL